MAGMLPLLLVAEGVETGGRSLSARPLLVLPRGHFAFVHWGGLAGCGPSTAPENPERAALYFVSGVCIGLVLTLVALVMRISCHTDCRRHPTRRKFLPDRASSSEGSDSDEDGGSDSASDLSVRRHRRFERTLNRNVFTSAEELERAQRLEERERIIREIWMNGQPEVPATRNLNCYY
ncbi:PREDICTED: protein eva-1 homolog A [Elephantulus edwardii]|uniref:protein eva-1 homolog A n=1 Tax=Elephantulus edwardii TaxID=28737 RepID=UPI0003F06461|nr:PREDICTED: protein eva-1 homolog A [Elephantulus edwardii]